MLPAHRGKIRLGNLEILNAILYVLENGCKWRSLPKGYGPWHTVYARMDRRPSPECWIALSICCADKTCWTCIIPFERCKVHGISRFIKSERKAFRSLPSIKIRPCTMCGSRAGYKSCGRTWSAAAINHQDPHAYIRKLRSSPAEYSLGCCPYLNTRKVRGPISSSFRPSTRNIHPSRRPATYISGLALMYSSMRCSRVSPAWPAGLWSR